MKNITHFSIKKKLLAVLMLITFLFLLLGIRLFWVQIVDGNSLQLKAFDQWTRDLPMRADRGDIVDCNGIVLASSKTTFTLYGRPNEISDPHYIAVSIAEIVGKDVETLSKILSKKGVSEITVAKNLSKSQFKQLSTININGLYVTADSARNYPYGDYLTQVLGFTNVDGVGQSGVEQYYDKYLKGVDGQSLTQTDLIGKKLRDNVTTYLPSKKGATTQLTIDFYMQNFVEKAIKNVVATYNPRGASCIIMNANSGEIKSMYSYPSYDLNNPPRNDKELLLKGARNGLVSDAYEPGSTFKILTSAIGMEENKIKKSYYCNGGSIVDGQRIKCWRSIGHGSQTFEQGIHNSCNCVFMDIAQSVGVKKMYEYLQNFGIGKKTNVDILGEAKGIVLKEKNVKPVDIARIGFGQAIAVT
ncbi:MAG: penicillin-binding transpeptidase domain-containing protein, partial [Clostridia bacterium]